MWGGQKLLKLTMKQFVLPFRTVTKCRNPPCILCKRSNWMLVWAHLSVSWTSIRPWSVDSWIGRFMTSQICPVGQSKNVRGKYGCRCKVMQMHEMSSLCICTCRCAKKSLQKIKDTCYGLGKNSQNQQPLDILACNSANRPSFNKQTHTFLPHCP